MSIKYKELEERCIEKPIDFENNWKKTGYARVQKNSKFYTASPMKVTKCSRLEAAKLQYFLLNAWTPNKIIRERNVMKFMTK
jgi:hypothetical protein